MAVSKWIFHVDMGRKYFTLQELKAMIDALADNGFAAIELAFGNDGLRLILDDLAVEAGGVQYTSSSVAEGIRYGNKLYYDAGEKNELTESEMDELIAYAYGKQIRVVPLFNSPGHMDAVLGAMTYLGIENNAFCGSKTTLNLENPTAVAFTQNLAQKYIDYFAKKECCIFNMGADEYANDKFSTGEMGFGELIHRGEYYRFANYINEMSARIKQAGMKPMAFNDGFYFRENESCGAFDPDVIISYWTIGWDDYRPASADFISAKGHKIVNTRNEWYYVLGQAPGKNFCIEDAKKYPSQYSAGDVFGTEVEAIAAMQCLWCDFPYKPYTPKEAENIASLIRIFAEENR